MKKINVDDIIKEAAKLKGWYLNETGCIRITRRMNNCCPLTCGIFKTKPTIPDNFQNVTEKLNIHPRTADAIIGVADNAAHSVDTGTYYYCNPRLRKKMLKAFGLTEK